MSADPLQLLDDIERELQRLSLWDDEPPPVRALQSATPFCYDTLRLEQWLQWIFIPRARVLLAQGTALPGRCEIRPVAELRFAEVAADTGALERHIGALDEVLNRMGSR
ncbi:MAG: YqcC family protein [Chromatiales bacterium]|nr:YqcC family protein [Chromatiales bacterium]